MLVTQEKWKYMKTRPATNKDCKRLSELAIETCQETVFKELESTGEDYLRETFSEAEFIKRLTLGYRYFVMEEESINGFIGFKSPDYLYHLFVDKQAFGQGIASKLWQHALDCFLSEQAYCDLIRIKVNSSLYAEKIYKRMGFVTQSAPVNSNGIIFVPMRYENSLTG